MKRFMVLIIALCILFCTTAFAENTMSIEFDGKVLDINPFKASDVIMLPLREVMEGFGFKVFFNADTNEAHFLKGDNYSSVEIGSDKGNINGKTVSLGGRAVIVDGISYAPARFIKYASGKYVGWSVEKNSVILKNSSSAALGGSGAVEIPANELLKNTYFDIADTQDEGFMWKKYGYGNLSISDENPFFGKNCAYISGRTSNYSGISYDLKDILNENGQGKYVFSAYVRTNDDSESIGNTYSLIIRTQGKNDEKKKYEKASVAISEKWAKITLEADLKWSGELSDALLYFEGADKTDLNDYYIDMCSATKAE